MRPLLPSTALRFTALTAYMDGTDCGSTPLSTAAPEGLPLMEPSPAGGASAAGVAPGAAGAAGAAGGADGAVGGRVGGTGGAPLVHPLPLVVLRPLAPTASSSSPPEAGTASGAMAGAAPVEGGVGGDGFEGLKLTALLPDSTMVGGFVAAGTSGGSPIRYLTLRLGFTPIPEWIPRCPS